MGSGRNGDGTSDRGSVRGIEQVASLQHGHLRVVHAGVIERARADTLLEAFDEVRAMIWRLLNPKP